MRMTLLEMVQLILSSMDSDEVNSYDETTESMQVALLLKSVYYDIANDLGLDEHEEIFELIASGDNAKPTLMTLPTNAIRLDTINYDNKADSDTYSDYRLVKFMPFDKFMDMMNSLRGSETGIGQMTFTNAEGESFEVIYRTDKMPEYYTTWNDNTLLFDSYDSSIDTTLQKSKTRCYGSLYSTWTMSNSFIPDLDPTQFSYYINRAKARAFAEMKQSANQEAASEARRQKIITQKRKTTIQGLSSFDRSASFGRFKTNQ